MEQIQLFLIQKITVLKENFKHCQQLYDVYSDIAATYREISLGDYIFKLVEEEKKSKHYKSITAHRISKYANIKTLLFFCDHSDPRL